MKKLKIQIDGTNTLNKGAELMLVAILEQIEKKSPNSEVIYNSVYKGINADELGLNIKITRRFGLKFSRIARGILKRIKLSDNYFTSKYAIKNVDLVLDASGFQFSDQWNYSNEKIESNEIYYRKLSKLGSKIVFLPQAFGPFESVNGKESVNTINKYAHMIIAREEISYNFLTNAVNGTNNIYKYPDFTLLVNGIVPKGYEGLKDFVCIIPNSKMITHTDGTSNEYVEFMKELVQMIERNGHEVFLLNHEGKGDMTICEKINSILKNKLRIVSGLSAKEIKGIIGNSKLVISSRYHGVASALNQGIPCFATSWNHKYKMLFEDFGIEDGVLEIKDNMEMIEKKVIKTFENIDDIKRILTHKKGDLKDEVNEMWDKVWMLVEYEK
ncbi:polysaccharide pyruvyl transferase family protein [Echinicola sp. CAU 1574]|uniref:Polysaccharide pyruvyl transferase family protein n=1 Tax=Echinicola arenosa TaxID=2774144 RepID=A0ABR9AMT2_9BACT|nr:polysaccharide pyruvyl transferase family protein [Echinicola arenosa]MBD8490087.1 polysaccharide pyruvyl transferase family protein [Echinicola arenosa]